MLDMTFAFPRSVLTINAAPSKNGSLHARQTARPSRQVTTTSTKAQEFESVEHQGIVRMAPVTLSRRSVSCFELSSSEKQYCTIRIGEGSEELQRLAQANVSELIKTASSSAEADATNALLARKALRYRKIWTQEDGLECTSPPC